MAVEIRVPQLGESIVEATVGRWLKRTGEAVAAGEPVVELETEKVNLEVVTPEAGTLQSIIKQEGETVGIGEVLAVVGTPTAAATAPVTAPAASANGQQAAPASAPLPNGGSAPAPGAAPAPATTAAGESGAPPHVADDLAERAATPLARRIAAEHGIDLRRVTGSGPGGRVTQDDITVYLESQGDGSAVEIPPAATTSAAPRDAAARPPTPATPDVAPAPAVPQFAPVAAPSAVAPARGEERIRMSRRRQTIARRLVEAQHTAAMLTTFNEVDMSAIMDLRKRRRDPFKERHGVSLGFMSFFTKAVIGGLRAIPRLNAEIQSDEMVLKHYYDIGIAVSTEEGLVVPVVRDADRLNFAEIERRIAALADKARKKSLSLEDLQGGTFTITNGGVFGSLLSTPILNAPQVGILGMHKIQERPIALNGQVVIHPMMYVALSYDHRIVDGSEAVTFLVRVKELLEDPESLLLEG